MVEIGVENRNTESASSEQAIEITLVIADYALQPVVLDYRRAAYLRQSKTLLASDLHWGKGETFQTHGIPIPNAVLETDLERLSALINNYQPDRLLILGDLIHGRLGLTNTMTQTILQWRQKHALPIQLVEGNHDRAIRQVAEYWHIELIPGMLEEAPFIFSHEPIRRPDLFNWCGHIHPVIKLRSNADSLRLPCFHLTRQQGLLPAFSVFTGGYAICPEANDQVFALGSDFIKQINL